MRPRRRINYQHWVIVEIKFYQNDTKFSDLESDPVFHEIEQTVKAKPQEAKAVNSIYIFVIKQNGKPVKRWRKLLL